METAVIIEKEIEKLDCLKKFQRFITLCSFYHVDRCKRNNCVNCSFINKLSYIYTENFPHEVNETLGLQKFCREYFGSFFSLIILSKSLAAVQKEKIKLEPKFTALLEIWNANTNI